MNEYKNIIYSWAYMAAELSILARDEGHAHALRVLRTELRCISPEMADSLDGDIVVLSLGG